ncbi:prepilin-type N-terminal cleavage/methylation domain-containing protein [uncultured Methylibium sp.]|uniref:pilus assembly FimT family protein n=1 Tax=uncultured Methylibium sp. TaxID=381093 RepID=UPI0025F7BDA0|nr:prepilin-type N-terminal cleavage/methylation domain-containing protein [uncultured Methylibium sp.]
MLNRRPAVVTPQRVRGFTLIELVVTVALLGILLALAAPGFGTWINNTRVRTVSDALQNGVRQAQAEAVRRNRTAVFYLTNAQPSLAATAVANGSNWGIRTVSLFTGDAAEFVNGGSLSDVAGGVAIGGPIALCFNASGQQVTVAAQSCTAGAATYDVSRTGADRPLRITVSIGGRVRMCDPAKTLSATNPDGC